MLNGQWLIFLREEEHVEDDRLVASVLAMMNALFCWSSFFPHPVE
jgi:hypothetical protein